MTVENGVVEYQVEANGNAVVHESSDAPLCERCKQLDLSFFDPSCPGCKEILQKPSTTIPQLFAILRQWIPQTQQNINIIIQEMLNRGAGINDRDQMTDMTLLHYACKSGASGVGDVLTATQVVKQLIERGADVSLRCNWTNMSALHYAAYFNVAPVIQLLLQSTNGSDKNSTCHDFENGTALHIAAANLCLDAVNTLLKNGCDPTIRDDIGRNVLDCISSADIYLSIPDTTILISKLKSVLEEATPSPTPSSNINLSNTCGKVLLHSMGVDLGDDVSVNVGAHIHQLGKMRYCGKTSFAPGIWVGVEFDDALGRNDGSVDGIVYFKCPENHGIFVTLNRVSRPTNKDGSPVSGPKSSPLRNVNHPKVDLSHITSKIQTGLSSLRLKCDMNIEVGERVLTVRNKGSVKFSGQTHFAPGWWYGVELDEPMGKNDGSVNFIRYFTCNMQYGLFVPPTRIQRLTESKEDLTNNALNSVFGSLKTSPIVSPTGGSPRSLNCSTKSRFVTTTKSTSSNQNSNKWFNVGTSVYYNNEIAVVKYIGNVEFADGTWLGLELRSAVGKNDGTVQGKKYFYCKTNYGIMVRPSKVSIRGINGAKLI